MQNYYGLAIRDNVNNLFAMKKAVGASLYHCTDFADQNSRHLFYSKTEDTWCKWQLDKLKGTYI